MKTLVVIVVLLCAVSVFANKRDSNLFKLFPLPQEIADFYSTSSRDTFTLSSLVRGVATQVEAAKAESLTALLENKQNVAPAFSPSNYSVFHNYDADAVVIFGKGEINALRYLLKDEQYVPISLAHSGKGIIAVWIINHKDTSLGSYKELIISTIVAPKGMGHTLGVSYEPGNDASMFFAQFGKLPEHARYFVLHSTVTTDESKSFTSNVKLLPSEFGLASFGPQTTIEGKNVLHFEFNDAGNNPIISGSIPQDNSWSSYFKMGYKLFRAIGLAAILDLWNAPFVTVKFVGPVTNTNSHSKWNTFHMNMNQQFSEISPKDIQLGLKTQIGRTLRDLDFEATMITKMPNLQYAVMLPKDQSDDNEFTTVKLELSAK